MIFNNNIAFPQLCFAHVHIYVRTSMSMGRTTTNDYLTSTTIPGLNSESFTRGSRARHEYSISVITLLPQRVIHFGAVSNNFTTFCINKTVARFSRRFMVHFCRVLRDGMHRNPAVSLFPSCFLITI